MTDFLEQKQLEITRRLTELRPTVEEYERLQAAAAALDAIPAATETPTTASDGVARRRRGPGRAGRARRRTSVKATSRTPTEKAVKTARSKPTRRKAGGTRNKRSSGRSAEALTLVQGQPGITTRELATKMGIAGSYLYRILPGLKADGKIRKDGRGWLPAGS